MPKHTHAPSLARHSPLPHVAAPHGTVQLAPKKPAAHTEHDAPPQLPRAALRSHAHAPSAPHTPCPEHSPGHAPVHAAPKYPAAHDRHPVATAPQNPSRLDAAHALQFAPAQCPCVAFPKHTQLPDPSQRPPAGPHVAAHASITSAHRPASRRRAHERPPSR